MPARIKVRLASASAMVPDFEAGAQGVLRFHGRRYDPKVGSNGGFPATGEVFEVPLAREYLDELRAGVLVPADAEASRLTRIPLPIHVTAPAGPVKAA